MHWTDNLEPEKKLKATDQDTWLPAGYPEVVPSSVKNMGPQEAVDSLTIPVKSEA